MTVKTHTHTQIGTGEQNLFVYLFSRSVASMARTCGEAVGYCAVNALKFPKNLSGKFNVSVEHEK
jgi:uncharacterized protein YktB (UPF0637 family)